MREVNTGSTVLQVSLCRVLKQLMDSVYTIKVKVTMEEANEIERHTRDQHANNSWKREREENKGYSINTLAKIKRSTKRSKIVEEMLYSKFRGSQATKHGTLTEDTSINDYKTYLKEYRHTMTTHRTGVAFFFFFFVILCYSAGQCSIHQ